VSLALLEYRRGEYARATEWCQQCLASPDKNAARSATARVILAECNRRSDEARYQLGLGRDLIEGRFRIMTENDRGGREQGFWFDWVFARILLNEANVLIEKSSPAVLPGSSPEVN
jgi:hypothetical protein